MGGWFGQARKATDVQENAQQLENQVNELVRALKENKRFDVSPAEYETVCRKLATKFDIKDLKEIIACAGGTAFESLKLISNNSELFEKYGLSSIVSIYLMDKDSPKKTAIGSLSALTVIKDKIENQSDFDTAAITFYFKSVDISAAFRNHLFDAGATASARSAIRIANAVHSICDGMSKDQQKLFNNIFNLFTITMQWKPNTYENDALLLAHLCADISKLPFVNFDLITLLASSKKDLAFTDLVFLRNNLSKVPFKSEIPESAFTAAMPLFTEMFFDKSGKQLDAMLDDCMDIANKSMRQGMSKERGRVEQNIGDIFYALAVLNDKKAVLGLAMDFGIDNFLRYPPELLQEMAQLRVDNQFANDKPLVVIMLTKVDWNGAFYQDTDIYRKLLEHYRVVVCEVGTETEFTQSLRTMKDKFGYVSALFIGGHGTPNSIDLGEGDVPAENMKLSNKERRKKYEKFYLDITDKKSLAETFSGIFVQDKEAFVFLNSCSTGKRTDSKLSRLNIAETIAAALPKNVSVTAPEKDASIEAVYFTRKFGILGRLTPHVTYFYDTAGGVISAGRKFTGSLTKF